MITERRLLGAQVALLVATIFSLLGYLLPSDDPGPLVRFDIPAGEFWWLGFWIALRVFGTVFVMISVLGVLGLRPASRVTASAFLIGFAIPYFMYTHATAVSTLLNRVGDPTLANVLRPAGAALAILAALLVLPQGSTLSTQVESDVVRGSVLWFAAVTGILVSIAADTLGTSLGGYNPTFHVFSGELLAGLGVLLLHRYIVADPPVRAALLFGLGTISAFG